MKNEYQTLEINSFKTNRVLFIVFVIAALITYVIWAMSQTALDTYNDEKSFIKYADGQFELSKSFEMTGVEKTEYQYGEPFSYAVDYAVCDNENIALFRDLKIDELKEVFTQNNVNLNTENGEEEAVKPQALLVKTGVTENRKGITNLAIHERTTIKEGNEMSVSVNEIYTYQFLTKTGDLMVPEQIFKEDYKEHCSEYFTEYFSSEYDKEQLAEGWKEHLAASEENFNKFTVTDAGVTFYFDEGTVLKESEGIAYAGIANAVAKDIIRKKIIKRYIDPEKPMVALTYDDGPGLEAEDRILTCLENNNVVATFFYQGMFISGREDKIQRAKKIGCEIGHHTWNHPVLTSLTDAEASAQITNTNNAIFAACGSYPTVFRPSYGVTSDKINTMSGMPVIMWSVDTLDWESRDGQKVFDHVKSIGNLDGHIVLMHSIHNSTADATEMMVPWLKAQGYQLVTVTELIKYKTGADPVPGRSYRTYE